MRDRTPARPLAKDVDGFDALAELSLDLRSSWNHATDRVWQRLDPVLWELTHNPGVVLQTVSGEKLQRDLADPVFRKSVDDLVQARRHAADAPGWFQRTHAKSPLSCVAYFSMEFMLSEALPIYSGGLGNVAADQLKAASDLGVPVIGVGLLYQQGYFRQVIDKDGAQQALFPYNDPGQLPIVPLRHPNGEWLRLQLDLPGYPIWLRAWQVQAGRVKLHLLDSNDAANIPRYRAITSELYGGGPDLRLMQELVLGIGGWRLIEALGVEPEVCHLNEGHAAFAVLERTRRFMQAAGQPFEVALTVTRAGNLFTTHTAVAAGFDCFAPDLIERYLGDYARNELGITLQDLLALGRPEARAHVIFLSDYDMLLTEQLVQGADVWLNTPRRPWEASGTSGMKVLVNGGINLSELDGWWAEAYTPELGWALGDGKEHGDDPAWDAAEAEALYDLLEREVIPAFYSRDEQGIPRAWVARVRESMAQLTPHFSADRTVREYTEQHYLPAAAAYLERAANKAEIGVAIANWRRAVEQGWTALRFGETRCVADGGQYAFEVQVCLYDLDPRTVRVELYADGINGGAPVRQEMKRTSELNGTPGGYVYRATAPAVRSPADYTPRVVPYFEGVAIPLEDARILWR